ncbi:MAG: ribosome silencing factor [Rickettsiales bacterium]|nr:ribosome silencing factor [Rickettsiales bacterium]
MSAHDADSLIHVIEEALDDSKAEEIVTIDLAGKSSFADYMIVASGRSSRHVTTLAHRLASLLKEKGAPIMAIEGKDSGDWVLVDCGNIIVHLFKPEAREIYQLEKMWSAPVEAPQEEALA